MRNKKLSPEDLKDHLIDFAVRIGTVADAMSETRLGQHIANQIARSGTSPAPNYSEGCATESRGDFAHKLSISLKELRETKMWLRLIQKAELLPATGSMPSPTRPISCVPFFPNPSIERRKPKGAAPERTPKIEYSDGVVPMINEQ